VAGADLVTVWVAGSAVSFGGVEETPPRDWTAGAGIIFGGVAGVVAGAAIAVVADAAVVVGGSARVGAFGATTDDSGNSREGVVFCPAAFGLAGAATPGGAVLGVCAGAALGGDALTGGCAIGGRCVTAPGRGALAAGVDARIMNQTMAATVASARIAALRIELAGRGLSDL
jgi:hypothetical protein